MFKRILLAVDGSEHAARAVKVAAELAQCIKAAELRVLVAYDPIPPYLGEPNLQEVISARLKIAQGVLQDAVKAIDNSQIDVHSELVEGNPAETIIEVAETRHSDVIVMGSRGLGKLAGLLLGSTSQKVVSHAPCPVLIVR